MKIKKRKLSTGTKVMLGVAAVFLPTVVMADSCEVIDGNDMLQHTEQHVDWAYDQWNDNIGASLCFSWVATHGGDWYSDPCWTSNIVWDHIISWHKYNTTRHPEGEWVSEDLGWYSHGCKVWSKEYNMGEPLGGPCYTINGQVIS